MLLPKHEERLACRAGFVPQRSKDVRQNAPCVSFAIKRIGEQEYVHLQFNRAFAPENHPLGIPEWFKLSEPCIRGRAA
jgi:hypothetical protein